MSAKIIEWDGITRLDIPVSRVLRSATKGNLKEIVIIGYDADGNFWFSSNKADGGDVLWLMEIAKRRLLEIADVDNV